MKKKEMNTENISIMIVEDNYYIRTGWEIVLTSKENFKITGSFSNCEDAINSNSPAKSNVVLMDIGLPGISGIEGTRILKEKYPDLIIIMCTVHEENEKIFEALCAGAVGYLTKSTMPEQLIKSITEAYNGGSPMTPNIARKVIMHFQGSVSQQSINGQIKLNDRELEILNLMAKGKSYSVIAESIFLSVDGVYYHIRHIYEKLNVHSRAEAVAAGFNKKLIHPPA